MYPRIHKADFNFLPTLFSGSKGFISKAYLGEDNVGSATVYEYLKQPSKHLQQGSLTRAPRVH